MYNMFAKTLYTLSTVLMLWLILGGVSGQTIDEIIANASSRVSHFDPGDDISATVVRVELDMKLSMEQYSTLYDKRNLFNSDNTRAFPRMKRKAIKDTRKRWTNKEVPYSFQWAAFTPQEKSTIYMAIQEWEEHTCLTFRHATGLDYSFIRFEDGSECSSYVGMIPGKNPISLDVGCRSKRIILHEIGHAIGFYHEQSRPDRDNYVFIKKQNIDGEDLYVNFFKYSSASISTYDVPYDYKSIMHYGARYFSGNGQITIQTIDPDFQEMIGKSQGLSFLDIKLANLMYKCNESCRSTVKCPKEGFVGKDCKCWCPGDPIERCDGSGTNGTTESPLVTTTTGSTARPTIKTTLGPTTRPTARPTLRFTDRRTLRPTINPTLRPTIRYTFRPTARLTLPPTVKRTFRPTFRPTVKPTFRPTFRPTVKPTLRTTFRPTIKPTLRSTFRPTFKPTLRPTFRPTLKPTARPTLRPTPTVCADLNSQCSVWKKSGFCLTSPYVRRTCKLSCFACKGLNSKQAITQ